MPELAEIPIVALSPDAPSEAQRHRARDQLEFALVADPKLEAIDALGLRHEKGLPFQTFFIFGIPLGWPKRFRALAIPTTIMIDSEGIVRWIDQATDYRMRGDADRIRAGLESLSGQPGAAAETTSEDHPQNPKTAR